MNKEIALIGCGYWGTIILNTLKKISKIKFVYISDKDKLKTNLLKKRFNNFVKVVSLNYIINNNNIKYIYLATPPINNFKIIKRLIPKNKNILLEKPGFRTLSEFKKLKLLLSKSDSKLRFGYIYLHNQYIKLLKKIISKKNNGKIKYISFQRQNFGPIRNDVNSFLDLATHDLSILKFLFNKKIYPKKIIKNDILKKNSGDIIFANFKSNKVNIDISVSWLNPEKIRKITVITNKKMILFDEMDTDKPIKIYQNYANYPKITKYSKNYFTKKAFIYKGKSKFIKLKKIESPLINEINSFINDKKDIANLEFASEIIKISKKLKTI